ncbi:hypothetical protein K6L59_02850 [Candidatus Phytoplasma sp. Tabriz.2]|nr:hypothetical protein [Candidatus Phytoplasma australiense]MBZ7920051.1 hypothetical protein [Candidatus Karelsulcia muelleri]
MIIMVCMYIYIYIYIYIFITGNLESNLLGFVIHIWICHKQAYLLCCLW